jgi:hypothetical protein
MVASGAEYFIHHSEAFMHAKLLLAGTLALLLGACSPKVSHAPPPINKQLLAGKWKNSAEMQFISGYEFAEDGSMKMIVKGMKEPVPGRYAWNGERTLEVTFKTEADVQKAFQEAAKAYKEGVKTRIKEGKLTDRAEKSILGAVPDELPAEESFQASFAEKPRLLILVNAGKFSPGTSHTFEPAE